MSEQTTRQEKLPDEILESQKTRSELLRWKLMLCAGLGAAGFGLTSDTSPSRIGLLALIPLACAYVDLLCTNINLRIILIGRHLSDRDDPYESFVGKHRIAFCLEDWALYGSTYVISGLLILLALVYLVLTAVQVQPAVSVGWKCIECAGILMASLITIILTQWTQQAYGILRQLKGLAEDIEADKHFVGLLSHRNGLFRLFAKMIMRGADADHS